MTRNFIKNHLFGRCAFLVKSMFLWRRITGGDTRDTQNAPRITVQSLVIAVESWMMLSNGPLYHISSRPINGPMDWIDSCWDLKPLITKLQKILTSNSQKKRACKNAPEPLSSRLINVTQFITQFMCLFAIWN